MCELCGCEAKEAGSDGGRCAYQRWIRLVSFLLIRRGSRQGSAEERTEAFIGVELGIRSTHAAFGRGTFQRSTPNSSIHANCTDVSFTPFHARFLAIAVVSSYWKH
jgi:hypothetical protein